MRAPASYILASCKARDLFLLAMPFGILFQIASYAAWYCRGEYLPGAQSVDMILAQGSESAETTRPSTKE